MKGARGFAPIVVLVILGILLIAGAAFWIFTTRNQAANANPAAPVSSAPSSSIASTPTTATDTNQTIPSAPRAEASLQPSTSTANWLLYSDSKYGFSVMYPPTFAIATSTGGSNALLDIYQNASAYQNAVRMQIPLLPLIEISNVSFGNATDVPAMAENVIHEGVLSDETDFPNIHDTVSPVNIADFSGEAIYDQLGVYYVVYRKLDEQYRIFYINVNYESSNASTISTDKATANTILSTFKDLEG